MTGTTDDKIVITMEDVRQGAKHRMGTGVYVKVDDELELYLAWVVRTLLISTKSTDLFSTLHTLLEVGIQTGIDAERKRHAAETLALMKAVADAPVVD